jgi:hypothetical protein
VLVFAWRPPTGAADSLKALAAAEGRHIDYIQCLHGEGPPVCWCRPPLPGAWLWFARRRNVARAGSLVVSCSPAHIQLAKTVGVFAVSVR